jgi:hypothetical protein
VFTQILPWLIIAALIGVVLGLVIGIYIASSPVQRYYHHFQAMQSQARTQPLSTSGRKPVRYLDDEPFVVRPRR